MLQAHIYFKYVSFCTYLSQHIICKVLTQCIDQITEFNTNYLGFSVLFQPSLNQFSIILSILHLTTKLEKMQKSDGFI